LHVDVHYHVHNIPTPNIAVHSESLCVPVRGDIICRNWSEERLRHWYLILLLRKI